MLTVFWSAFWQSGVDIFGSTLVTNYLFPLVSGTWLAFLTANLIKLRTDRARAVAELFNMRRELLNIPMLHWSDYQWRIVPLGEDISAIADDLRIHGFHTTADALEQPALNIRNKLLTDLANVQQIFGVFPIAPEDMDKDLFQPLELQFYTQFRSRAGNILKDELPIAQNLILESPTDWFAALELTSLARSYHKFCRTRKRRKKKSS